MTLVSSAVRVCVLCLVVVVLGTGNAWSQVGTTSIYGEVTDPQGAAVPGARVTLTNQATGAVRTTETGPTGRYQVSVLPPGRYDLKVEMPGFRTAVRNNVELQVNTTSKLSVGLEIGAIAETVVVTEAAAALNTTDASVGNVLTVTQIEGLPMEARNITALLTLQPGVTFSGDPTDQRSGSVAGGRSDQANVTLDGVDVNDQQTQTALTTALPIPVSAIQEFRFTTVNAGAEAGRSSGGQIALVTKSGGNSFHGEGFWTHRNTATTANDFFNNRAGIEVPRLQRHQFGGNIGGPVWRDRMFFFYAYEGNRRKEESNELRDVPTASVRDGVLIYRCATASQCPGNTIAGLSGAMYTAPSGHRALTPAEIQTLDPLGLGVNTNMIPLIQSFPACNDFGQGLDANIAIAPMGLNFCGFRFNAPIQLVNNVSVARLDFHVTRDGRHSAFWRGTLGDLSQDTTPQQFPGQPVASQLLDNSKGYVAGLNSQLSKTVINTFRYGYTRQGREFSGQTGASFSIRSYSLPFATNRALIRLIPTHNIKDDAQWVYGKHTFQGGIDFRIIRNNRSSFAQSFPAFSINDGFCFQLCNGIVARVADPMVLGAPAVASGFVNPFKRAIMGLYGTITTISSAAFFDGTANTLAAGQGTDRIFAANEYEFYVQDIWRMTRNFTFTFGLRYGYYGVPYEINGLQTQPTVDIDQWFAQRVNAMFTGGPSNSIPILQWDLAGPANDKPSYYRPDKNNVAPNVSFAWTPGFRDGWLAKLTGGPGKSVIRGGARVVFDRVGGAFVVSQDLSGSFGLVSPLINVTSTLDIGGPPCTVPPSSPCAAPRFTGLSTQPTVPDFVSVPAAGFPSTPSPSFSSTGFAISNNLRTPYAYTLQFSYGRETYGNTTVEIGYVGRLAHKLLAKADLGAPLIYLVDPTTGTNLAQATNLLYELSQRGGLAASAITQTIPYFENLFSNLAGTCTTVANCTATQRVYERFRFNFPSFTDALAAVDLSTNPLLVSTLGRFTFFQQQFQSLPVWTNMGLSNYHALQITVRKRPVRGLSFDANYTWGRSMDNASTVENTDRLGGQIADAFFPKNAYSPSGFDLKHQFTANWIYELPFGRGRAIGGNASGFVNQVIGGWQTAGIIRWRSAFPVGLANGFNFPTNFFLTGPGTQICPMGIDVGKNAPGGPNLFGSTDAQIQQAFDCLDFTLMGFSGSRNPIRGARFFNFDYGLRKSFSLPFEGHKFIFDWQVFNLPNHPNFDDRSLSTNPESRGTFGRFTRTIGGDERNNNGRVMQFTLKYQF